MRRAGLSWIAVVAAIVVSGGCSKDEPANGPPPDRPGTRTGAVGAGGAGADLRTDDEFVRDVALKHIAAAELSRLALTTSTSTIVKAFAQRIVDEDGAAGSTLKSVAPGQSSEWPAGPDEKHRQTIDELASMQGTDFDQAYVKAMIESHQDLTAKLESRLDVQSVADWKTAAAGRAQSLALPEPTVALRDVDIRPDTSSSEATMRINRWAADVYPVEQKHLDTARALENATKERRAR